VVVMKLSLICGTIFASFLLTFNADASSVPFDTGTYNFPLAGGGGGSQATLNGLDVEAFCDDFANEISDPSNHTATVTQLGSGADLSATRFGNVSSWATITGTTDDGFFNGAAGSAASARYDMVAWLVSQYNMSQGDNTSNNQIQEAIWTLMDPAAYATDTPPQPLIDPSGVGVPITDLENAANWYLGGGATNSFLSKFEVVSDSTMTPGNSANGYVGVGGFQEQIVMTPEPRGGIWMLFGLLGVGAFLLRRAPAAESGIHRAN
jgi:hypothetical protein